jgi:LPS-assembly lipoprotein
MIARQLFALLLLALALPAVVSGCGWEPLYADHETATGDSDLRAVVVAPIPERVGQQLEIGLRNSFNPDGTPTKPLYKLNVVLQRSLLDLGIQSQGLGTRGDVHLVANYQLAEIATGKVLQTGFIHATDSFDIQANGYSTVVAQDDASRRDVEEIRREIVSRLTMFMQHKQAAAS